MALGAGEGHADDVGAAFTRLLEEPLVTPDPAAVPGTFEHIIGVIPPWLGFWARYRPGAA